MAKIAVALLAQGDGWMVENVVCTSGPQDRSFEEQHSRVSIAIVAAGTFQYRSAAGSELMTPGSLLLGNMGQCFECGHEHGVGDRCVSFGYTPEYFERLAADAGARQPVFRVLRLPPLRELSRLVARAGGRPPWEELSVQLAARAIQLANGVTANSHSAPASAVARVTRAVRMIERHPETSLPLASLAREAGLSSYHFLRTFERLTGLTPHQYVMRARLRQAAARLVQERHTHILDISLDSGFGDVSNFNRSFRTEFGMSPRAYRSL